MFISHFLVAPLLLHRYFPSKVGPTTLVMASVAPDIVSDLYLIVMEFMRMMFKQKVEIHDHTKPPGWIELDSGKPLGIGEWTHSLGGAMWWAGSLALLTGLYHATRKQTDLKAPTTPPSTPAVTAANIADNGAPPELSSPSIIALLHSPHIYRAMLAMGSAVMSHIFLDTFGENSKALLHPMSTHRSKQSSADSTSPAWTLVIDILLALLSTYLYTLNSHIPSQSLYRLTGLTAILFMFQGSLYLSHPASLTTTITVPTTSPNVAGAWWNLMRYVCGAILVGGVLQSIPRHLGNAGRESGGVGEMTRTNRTRRKRSRRKRSRSKRIRRKRTRK
ncbi:hypothetical protein BGX38DRAFT_286294 [Terfezia claveryi]|nr:hypothetical protein BGX38DRAFT_286294 [Terfezia claveryi]